MYARVLELEEHILHRAHNMLGVLEGMICTWYHTDTTF